MPRATPALRIEECRDHEARADSAATVGEAVLHEFAAAAAAAADPDAVRRALEAASRWAAGGDAVAIHQNGDGPTPAASPGLSTIPIRAGKGRDWGRIVLRRRPEAGARPAAERRRLESLATLAALALDRLHAEGSRPLRVVEPPHRSHASSAGSLHDATFISAVLPFAIAQARRHKESIAVLCISIDPLRGIRELMGEAEAERVVARVGARIVGLLRSSDLVGRLDDDRLMVVLPRAEVYDAVRVGEKLIRAVAADQGVAGLPLSLSLTVGAATMPSTASTLGGLLDAADSALSSARRRGPGRIAAAPAVDDSQSRDVVA